MRRATTGALATVLFGAACLAVSAGPAELLPGPLEGWTASGPAYGESLIGEGGSGGGVPPKRIEVSRDYTRPGSGLRIALNTHDRRGVQIIEYVNKAQGGDPEAAAALAAKGIVPFAFASRQGVSMRAQEDGQITGAALRLGENGTLTLEGVDGGKPDTVALAHVKAYLERIDLDRMAGFVRETNRGRQTLRNAK